LNALKLFEVGFKVIFETSERNFKGFHGIRLNKLSFFYLYVIL